MKIKRPARTVSKYVGKVGEIERHLIAKDAKRTQWDQHDRSEADAAAALVSMAFPMHVLHVLCQNDQWLAIKWDSNSRWNVNSTTCSALAVRFRHVKLWQFIA